MTRVVLPGLVDVHVHLRVPGGEHKETVETGTAAALAGGFTAILAMPNTTPPLTDAASLGAARATVAAGARCDVGLYLGATEDNAEDIAGVAGTVGLKIYVNDTYGPLRVQSLAGLEAHIQTWPRGQPLVVHAEGQSLAAVIGLVAVHRRWVHIAHVSRADEILLIRESKEAGLPITCEVAPHHLFLTDDDARALGGRGEVRPRLATRADVDALWANLGVVDCIATDHAPHLIAEKDGADPPPGFPGLETALPLMLTAVNDGRLTLDRLVELMSTNPARLFGIATPSESATEVDLGLSWELPASAYETKADWSPFAGARVTGRVVRTVLRGSTAFEDGEVLAHPGSGRLLPVVTPKLSED